MGVENASQNVARVVAGGCNIARKLHQRRPRTVSLCSIQVLKPILVGLTGSGLTGSRSPWAHYIILEYHITLYDIIYTSPYNHINDFKKYLCTQP